MDEFKQDFMRKVKTSAVEGEVVGAARARQKPIDKRWFVMIGLIVILAVTFVVLFIISNSKNSSNNTQPQNSQTDPISTQKITNSVWNCDDHSTITFDTNNKVVKTGQSAILRNTYTIKDTQLSFGAVTGTVKDDQLTLSTANKIKIVCNRSNS